jgi:di/tricarboxylate transporter
VPLTVPSEQQRTVIQKELPIVSFLHELREARWRILVAILFFVALAVMFAVIGTQTFWKGRINWQGWLCLYTLIVTISVLIFELWDVTLTFFVANCVFLFSGIITLPQALAGFSNASIIAIGSMFVIAVALEKVRLLDWMVRNVLRRPTSLRYALLRVLPACAFLSAWTNNTPIVAVMIPVMEVWSIRAEIPVSQLLMPMSFAVILGGLCTIIGTSTNLVIQGLAGSSVNLGFFTVGALAAPFAVLGVSFMVLFGPWLLPTNTEKRTYIPREFAWHCVGSRSAFLGQTLLDSKLSRVPGAELVWIKFADDSTAHSLPDLKAPESRESLSDEKRALALHTLKEGDMLLYVGVAECIEEMHGVSRMPHIAVTLEKLAFFELSLSETFVSVSVEEFNRQFSCRIRLLSRNGHAKHGISDVIPGDVLVVEGDFELLHLHYDPRFVKVSEVPLADTPQLNPAPSLVRRLHPWIALIVLIFVVTVNAVGLFDLYFAACIGIIVLLVTGIMNWAEVIEAIPGNLLLMIAYSFSLAAAMTNSGLGALLGESFALAFSSSPYVQLMGIYLVTNIITAVASNAASAAIMYPIVVNYSKTSGLSIYAGLFMIMIASSADFNTPFGYQTNLMVQKPGGFFFFFVFFFYNLQFFFKVTSLRIIRNSACPSR